MVNRRDWFEYGYLGIESVPRDVVGLYSFWCRAPLKCVYVGLTERPIRERLQEHFAGSHSPELNRWISCFAEDLVVCWADAPIPIDRLRALEHRFIRRWRPWTNRQLNK